MKHQVNETCQLMYLVVRFPCRIQKPPETKGPWSTRSSSGWVPIYFTNSIPLYCGNSLSFVFVVSDYTLKVFCSLRYVIFFSNSSRSYTIIVFYDYMKTKQVPLLLSLIKDSVNKNPIDRFLWSFLT